MPNIAYAAISRNSPSPTPNTANPNVNKIPAPSSVRRRPKRSATIPEGTSNSSTVPA